MENFYRIICFVNFYELKFLSLDNPIKKSFNFNHIIK